ALWWTAARAFGDIPKAAVATSLSIVVFFSYGHLAKLVGVPLAHFQIFSISFGENRAPALIWTVLVVLLALWVRRMSRQTAAAATVVLDRVGIALIALIVLDLATSVYASGHATAAEAAARRPSAAPRRVTDGATTRDLPDIYYIILDDYARADVLNDLYSFDNGPFLDFLKDRGFYVAAQSHSNYSQTMLSLASSLNTEYLDAPRLQNAAVGTDPSWHVALNVAAARYFEKGRAFGIDGTGLTTSRLPLAHMIQYSSVVQTLKEHGYRFVAFTSGYGGVQLPHADIVMRAHVVDDFEEVLIDATPIPRTFERLYDGLELHRERVEYVFDHLADKFADGSPLFVFAHILCPHTPFVFEADGTPTPRQDVILDDRLSNAGESRRGAIIKGYRDQIQFVNRRIETVIDAILAHASKPPIIIVQG